MKLIGEDMLDMIDVDKTNALVKTLCYAPGSDITPKLHSKLPGLAKKTEMHTM